VGSRAELDVSEMRKILYFCRYPNPGSSRPVSHKMFCSRILTHIIAHVNIEFPDDRNSKLKVYTSEMILGSYQYIPVAHVTIYCMI